LEVVYDYLKSLIGRTALISLINQLYSFLISFEIEWVLWRWIFSIFALRNRFGKYSAQASE